jgi:hypothetical protein
LHYIDCAKYRARRDPRNWRIAQAAVRDFMSAYLDAKQKWMDNISEELKVSSGNMWQKINKMIKGSSTTVVQLIRLSNGEYIFEDEDISDRMRDVHILRMHVKADNFDEEWHYHVEKASRPLSLTSAVGKLIERIVCRRLLWFLESSGLMVPMQFAYRKKHNFTQAILILQTYKLKDIGINERLLLSPNSQTNIISGRPLQMDHTRRHCRS